MDDDDDDNNVLIQLKIFFKNDNGSKQAMWIKFISIATIRMTQS